MGAAWPTLPVQHGVSASQIYTRRTRICRLSEKDHRVQQQPPNPNELVRRAAANEIEASNSPVYFMFKDRTEEKGHAITKEVIQTPQGGLLRTIAINDKPLTPEQRAKDDQKL